MARKTKKSTKARTSLRTRLIVAGVVLGAVAATGITFKKIYDRGLKREALFDKARKAARKERWGAAARLARETLATEPKNLHAKELLVHALVRNDQLDEAREAARRFLEEGHDFAAIALCNIAMQEGEFAEAEQYARRVADRKPIVAYRLLGFIQDLRGITARDWRARFQAAATMRNLASLTELDSVKSEALLVGASIMVEIAPHHPNPESMRERARLDLKEAASAAGHGRQADRSFNYDLAMGRIRLLSDDEAEARLGAKMLRRYTTGALRTEHAIASLAQYHIRREEFSEALVLMRDLTGAYLWNRTYWVLRDADRPEIALKALETSPHTIDAERGLLKADLLLQGEDEGERQQAFRTLTDIVREEKTPTSRVLRALLLLAARFDVEAAQAAAADANLEERNDHKITAFLATLYAADEENEERGLDLARRLARSTDDAIQSRDVMRILSNTSTSAFAGYVEAKIEAGGDSALQHRLQRAVIYLARAKKEKDPAAAESLRGHAFDDLEAIRDDATASKGTLAMTFNLAAATGEFETAGALLGRMAAMEGDPGIIDVRVLQYVAARPGDDPMPARLAAGVRSAVSRSPAPAYLEALAAAIESRVAGPMELLGRLEKAAEEEGSRVPALELAARIATGAGDLERGASLARAALEAAPERMATRELVGAIALRRGAADEILALYPDFAQTTEIGGRQVVGAKMLQEKKDEALDLARRALQRFPSSPDAHVLVAQIYLDRGEKRKALSVLSIAPVSVLIAHMRAELLMDFQDHAMAEQLYVGLLVSSEYKDVKAWQGLRKALARAQRTPDFTALSSRVLKSPGLRLPDLVRSAIHYMRGLSLEQGGSLAASLADYEAAIRYDPNAWHALNNAAWHIATLRPSRIEEARAYIDRARKLQPTQPSLMDTAAEVLAVQGDFDGALEMIDAAIALKPAGKTPGYTVHKARLLLRMKREEETRLLLESVIATWPHAKAATEAKELLWKMEADQRSEERVAEELLPDLPPDKEGAGG